MKQPSYFPDPAGAPALTQMPGLRTRILTGISGERMMMVLNETLPGHTVPPHTHSHEQIGVVYSGSAELRIGDQVRIVHQGDFYCIPAGVLHGDTCVGNEPFVMLDVFHPVREDFLARLAEGQAGVEAEGTARQRTHAGTKGALGEGSPVQIIDKLFAMSPLIRYVAIYRNGEHTSVERPGLANASAGESDKYEELLVNPTLLTLLRQRGEIDCGGLDYVLIRYGTFFQLVQPLQDGHLSIAFEPDPDLLALVARVREAVFV